MSEHKTYMEEAAEAAHSKLPDNHGIILLAVPYEKKGQCSYVSDLAREDAVNVLKEWLIKCGAEEDWMRHIR